MRLSVFFSAIFVLAASILTYAAPYGPPGTFLDIEQRSTNEAQSHAHASTSAVSASGSHRGNPSSEPSDTGVGREVIIITRPLAGSNIGIPPPTLMKHWAVMVGNHYYELHINNQIPNQATCSASIRGQAIEMHAGNTVPDLATGGWTSLGAYGVTHYTDAQIHAAGQRVMDAMSAHNYNLVANNCQDFATQLANCIVIHEDRRRRCIIA